MVSSISGSSFAQYETVYDRVVELTGQFIFFLCHAEGQELIIDSPGKLDMWSRDRAWTGTHLDDIMVVHAKRLPIDKAGMTPETNFVPVWECIYGTLGDLGYGEVVWL